MTGSQARRHRIHTYGRSPQNFSQPSSLDRLRSLWILDPFPPERPKCVFDGVVPLVPAGGETLTGGGGTSTSGILGTGTIGGTTGLVGLCGTSTRDGSGCSCGGGGVGRRAVFGPGAGAGGSRRGRGISGVGGLVSSFTSLTASLDVLAHTTTTLSRFGNLRSDVCTSGVTALSIAQDVESLGSCELGDLNPEFDNF